MTKQRIRLGAQGEDLAAESYRQSGWKILSRNWRCPQGELDIVACRTQKHRKTLAFCEVKTRSSLAYGYPAEAITSKKQNQIRKLAARWLEEDIQNRRLNHIKKGYDEIRFDVAQVLNGEVSIATYS